MQEVVLTCNVEYICLGVLKGMKASCKGHGVYFSLRPVLVSPFLQERLFFFVAHDEGSHVVAPRMGFTIGALIEAVLLFVNALAILNEERFLRPCALR